jgi:hypothetical protein
MRMKSDTMLNYERTLQEDESNFHKSLHFFIFLKVCMFAYDAYFQHLSRMVKAHMRLD